jgi:exopolysaccharide biosynthesis polyprenyl glycosylphosphotransferase
VCRVDAVYLAIPNARASILPRVLQRLERFAVDIRIVPDVNPRYLPQSMAVGELDGMPVLSYRESPLQGIGGVAKRAIDIVGSLIGLVVFAPVMLAAAIAVRLSGPGRVIFKQRRVSLGGQTFKIYKFRTMYNVRDEVGPASTAHPGWTARNDPRITPVGRFLRRTSIDELPQLLNVLKGSMSLVGPRPERPELIERFRVDWRGYMLRQHVKAGITGWAQVNGLRGDTSLRKRLQYDRFYIRNWSLWFDLRILALTLVRGWVHRNAH